MCSALSCYPAAEFEAIGSLIITRHNSILMLFLVVLQPFSTLLPHVAIDIPNESHIIKALDMFLAQFASGLCHTSLVNPIAKFKAISSLITLRYKHMSMLSPVVLQPVDALLPQVIKNIPNKSQFVKASDLLLTQLAFGLCHAFFADPNAKLEAIRIIIMRHQHMSMLSFIVFQPAYALLPPVAKNIPDESQVVKAFDLLPAKLAFGFCHASVVDPKPKFKTVRSDIIRRHKYMAVLCFVLLKPVDALLPQVIRNIPNKPQVVKAFDLLLAKLAFGLCHTFLVHPTAKFKAVRSDTIAGHKYMSVLCPVFLEPSDPQFPPVIKNIPNKSQVVKDSDLLLTQLAFGLCHAILADPDTKFKSVRSDIIMRHQYMSMFFLVVFQPADALLPPVTKNMPHKSQVIKAFPVLLKNVASGLCHASVVNPKPKFKTVRSDIIRRHKYMAVLCFVLLQPVDALLPQVIRNIPNKPQVVKAFDLLLAKLAFGLCRAFLADPNAKFKAVRSLIL